VPLHRGVQRVLLRTVAVEVVVLCLLGVWLGHSGALFINK